MNNLRRVMITWAILTGAVFVIFGLYDGSRVIKYKVSREPRARELKAARDTRIRELQVGIMNSKGQPDGTWMKQGSQIAWVPSKEVNEKKEEGWSIYTSKIRPSTRIRSLRMTNEEYERIRAMSTFRAVFASHIVVYVVCSGLCVLLLATAFAIKPASSAEGQ